ncbi:MAG: HD domain-containing protein [bacterium]|nr:HD domain-containing protein [bacterium]
MGPVNPRPLSEILAAMSGKSAADIALVTKAYEFSKEAHKEQKRYSGDAYFIHPAEVGCLLAQAGMDAQAIAAGLLHDTIEDAGIKPKIMEEQFGHEVLSLVEGVTKLGTLRYRGLERHTESLRKLFAATAKDIRVLIIKLMDRLHNARTLGHVPKVEKRTRIAQETLEIYAPIADRLGMSVTKQELEDAAFPHAFPKEYEKTRELLKERRKENEKRLEKVEHDLKRELAEAGLRNFRTEARIKGIYSLYLKLGRRDISKIYDILALRVIFPSVADCYSALGIIHGHWRPVPGKIKDYIAFPKPNGYQSIHTTVYTGDGSALEMQLRTEAQHREALYGIASHLTYKEMREGGQEGKRGGLEWMRQFFPRRAGPKPSEPVTLKENTPEWLQELARVHQGGEASEEYLDTLKSDFFSHRVFVFTPKGDVIDLPVAATPIDFAYAVHSDLGNRMSGARVNGKMVSLETALRNGDMVEIITKPSAKPSRKWHDIAKTNMAKKHIRAALAAMEASAKGGSAFGGKKKSG